MKTHKAAVGYCSSHFTKTYGWDTQKQIRGGIDVEW